MPLQPVRPNPIAPEQALTIALASELELRPASGRVSAPALAQVSGRELRPASAQVNAREPVQAQPAAPDELQT
jgi:hypothetical protein